MLGHFQMCCFKLSSFSGFEFFEKLVEKLHFLIESERSNMSLGLWSMFQHLLPSFRKLQEIKRNHSSFQLRVKNS